MKKCNNKKGVQKNNSSLRIKIMVILSYLIIIEFIKFVREIWTNTDYPSHSFELMWLFLIVFWILTVMSIFLTIKIQKGAFYLTVISLSVLIFTVTIRLLFIPLGPGFFGYDANIEFANFWKLLEYSHAQTSDYLPGMYLLAAGISIISKISPWQVARFGPTFWSLLSPILLALVIKRQFSKLYPGTYLNIAGVISMAMYAELYTFIMFHNIFHRESMAFIMLFIIIYLVLRLPTQKSKLLLPLSIAEVTLVITHHLTPVMLLGFMLLVSVIMAKNEIYPKVTLIMSILLFAYWRFEYEHIWKIQSFLIRDISVPSTISSSNITPHSLRYTVLIYGQIIFFIIFLVVSVISWHYLLIQKEKNLAKWGTVWMVWLIVSYALTFLSTFGILIPVKGVAFSTRFQLYSRIAITVLTSNLILSIMNQEIEIGTVSRRRKILVRILAMLILSNILFNYYRIHPSLYAPYNFTPDEPRPKLYTHELVACSWIKYVPSNYDPALRGPLNLWYRLGSHKDNPLYYFTLSTKYYPLNSHVITINDSSVIYHSKDLTISISPKT